MSDRERYQVDSRPEIIAILRSLIEQRSFVTVHFGDRDEFVIGELLAVNPDYEELLFDFGANEAANERMLAAADFVVATQLHNIRIQFESTLVEATSFRDGAAFRIPLPRRLLRLQRREHHRIRVPADTPLTCELRAGGAGDRPVAVRVYDIGCGGVALVEYASELDLVPGALHRGCRIDLAEIGVVSSDLQILHRLETPGKAGAMLRRCGGRFVPFTNSMAALIQRYVLKVECERGTRG